MTDLLRARRGRWSKEAASLRRMVDYRRLRIPFTPQTVFSEHRPAAIDRAALRVLEELGLRVLPPEAQCRFRRAGAFVTSADDPAISFDAGAKVAPGGRFFGAAHTMERYQTAFSELIVGDWSNFGTWTELGARDGADRAHGVWTCIVRDFVLTDRSGAHWGARGFHRQRRGVRWRAAGELT